MNYDKIENKSQGPAHRAASENCKRKEEKKQEEARQEEVG